MARMRRAAHVHRADAAAKSLGAEKGYQIMFCNSCNGSWLWIIVILILLCAVNGNGGWGCCGNSGNNGWGCCDNNNCCN